MEHQSRVLWDKVTLFGLVLVAGVALIWWLESRFGSMIAVMTLGLLGGVFFYAMGHVHNQRNSKATLEVAADFIHDLGGTIKSSNSVQAKQWEIVKEREKFHNKIDEFDYKQVQKMADQRAKFLADTQRQAENEMPTWADGEWEGVGDSGDGSFTHVE